MHLPEKEVQFRSKFIYKWGFFPLCNIPKPCLYKVALWKTRLFHRYFSTFPTGFSTEKPSKTHDLRGALWQKGSFPQAFSGKCGKVKTSPQFMKIDKICRKRSGKSGVVLQKKNKFFVAFTKEFGILPDVAR